MGSYNPVATYRLQFHGEFTFRDAEAIAGYLNKLGIGAVYASPVFQAVEGSTHGYDVTDPLSLNREIGTEAELGSLIRALHGRQMGWIQDVVPNHMGYSSGNPWIFDLLVKGGESDYARTFDLVTGHPDPELRKGIMWPFLGKPLEEVINDGAFTLHLEKNGCWLSYFSRRLPLSIRACRTVLEGGDARAVPPALKDITEGKVEPAHWEERMERLYRDYCQRKEIAAYLDCCMERVNGDKKIMEEVVEQLSCLPAYWKETERRINYRRFFTINGLICLQMQEAEVFRGYHTSIGRWVETGWFDGLRVDHVDGLYDPEGYLRQLRSLCGRDAYLVVEKILEKDESFPASWPVEGTTGYDFLAMASNLLTGSNNASRFLEYYRQWTGSDKEVGQLFAEKKRFILLNRLGGELDLLTSQCLDSGLLEDAPDAWEPVREALAGFMVHCPLYRIYNDPSRFTSGDRSLVHDIFRDAGKDMTTQDANRILNGLEKAWTGADGLPSARMTAADRLFRRIMQFTGPLMAKGLEDTAYYAYIPFLAHNEVGDSPVSFGISMEAFHKKMKLRRETTPMAMNTLSTHDTKRGEDARARLLVLSDLPDQWTSATRAWREMNRGLKQQAGSEAVPSAADEYLIYQALAAHIPMDGKIDLPFVERFRKYLVKALREAKENTSWSDPDPLYEELTLAFTDKILDPGHAFTRSMERFLGPVLDHGVINSLTQHLLKMTVPGLPDTYQGCETWNLSFVDPDNRRPVDYNKLSRDLDQMAGIAVEDRQELATRLWEEKRDGRIKQWFTHLVLRLRREQPNLFAKGSYQPLEVRGKFRDHVIAFYRQHEDEHILVALPLHTIVLRENHSWGKTRIVLPGPVPFRWQNILCGTSHEQERNLPLNELFGKLPFAVCRALPDKPDKRAGILMHVSSLPGDFGTGDLGPGARRFIDFLYMGGQRCWQVLPLNVTSAQKDYSPYSSESAFAGNVLFTDPLWLEQKGLLERGASKAWRIKDGPRADFTAAERIRKQALDLAYKRFKEDPPGGMEQAFQEFIEKESFWIEDYARYKTLKSHFNENPWYEWPDVYRNREVKAIAEFSDLHASGLDRIRFGQFVFSEQWSGVKRLARDKGIRLFGDIPIYVDHDSADAWAHPRLFRMHPDGRLKALAGVPPDYFNKDGQLWGMPLYDWDAMEKENYRWWIARIEKNLQWFDLLRLDHFRGFEAFWEVPPGEITARNGNWVRGPGARLFDAIRDRFPHMPFVAEDLGQISEEVYALRDRYGLAGMKVIQFGFGKDMASSIHHPGNITYNSIAYTGTHDNNTLLGWYRTEADRETIENIRAFTGKALKEKKVPEELIRLACETDARLVIIPMQDWLGLDEKSRMNFPATTGGNWLWKAHRHQVNEKLSKKIRKRVRIFGRF